jgi:serine/threonine protein kinase
MQSIHEHMMVHSDLKPANLVIVNGSIKIIDFGISKDCGANTTRIHREDNTGTVNYMSPEAIANGALQAETIKMVLLLCMLLVQPDLIHTLHMWPLVVTSACP